MGLFIVGLNHQHSMFVLSEPGLEFLATLTAHGFLNVFETFLGRGEVDDGGGRGCGDFIGGGDVEVVGGRGHGRSLG